MSAHAQAQAHTQSTTAHPVYGTRRVEMVLFTPDAARELLRDAAYANQRTERPWWAKVMSKDIRRGEYFDVTAIAIAVFPGGKHALLNGQHRFEAIVESGVPTELPVVYIDMPTEEAAFSLYMKIDSGLVRTAADFSAELRGEFGAQTKREVTQSWAAVGFLGSHFQPVKHGSWEQRSKDYRLLLLRAFLPELAAYMQILHAGDLPTRNAMLRMPIVAVALVTLHWQFDMASVFWGEMAQHGEGLKRADQRRALLRMLRDSRSASSKHNLEARQAANVWNQLYTGRAPKTLKDGTTRISAHHKPLPLDLLGTPYRSGLRDGRPTQIVPTTVEFEKHKVHPTVGGSRGSRLGTIATPYTRNFVTDLVQDEPPPDGDEALGHAVPPPA